MTRYRHIILLLFIVLSVSCKGDKTEATPTAIDSPVNSPLIPPTAVTQPGVTVEALIVPTSQPGLATVTGVILQQDTMQSIQSDLFLGEVIDTTDPLYPIVGLDKTTAPKAMLDINTGAFAFYDVPPGRYALEIWRPVATPVLVDDPESGGTLFLTLQADDVVDLGTIYVVIP